MNDNITLVRGDTLAFGVEIEGVDRLEAAYFSVKALPTDEEYTLQAKLYNGIDYIDNEHYRVRLSPAQTAKLDIKTYHYDLEISVNGDTFTVLSGLLEVVNDITKEEWR